MTKELQAKFEEILNEQNVVRYRAMFIDAMSASYDLAMEEMKNEAVGFLDFIAKNDYKPGSQNKHWYKWIGIECEEKPYTTEQLFSLYKSTILEIKS